MDWPTYKALCDQGDVQSRFLLEETCALLFDARLIVELRSLLAQEPLSKPPDHRAGPLTDMFPVALTSATALAIRDSVADAAEHDRCSPRTAERGLGGFVESWTEVCEIMLARERGENQRDRT